MITKLTDAVTVSGARLTSDGFLIADAKAVRSGIQLYRGSEVGKADMETVRVYRPPEEVFAADSLQSFSHAPVTMDHPAEAVTADNWKRLAVGETSGEVVRDGEWLRIPLIVKDKTAILAIQSGKRELSAGYTCTLDWTPGTTPDGETYDAVQRGIKINHLAVVDEARAGADARIGDAGAGPQAIRDAAYADYVRSISDDAIPTAFNNGTARLPDIGSSQAMRDAAYSEMVSKLDGVTQ